MNHPLHRTLRQVAELRVNQFYISLEYEKHCGVDETIASWQNNRTSSGLTYAGDFSRRYGSDLIHARLVA